MTLQQLRKVDRVVGVAGGVRKTAAIRAALRGGLVNVLITDRFTAERLLQPDLAEPRRLEPLPVEHAGRGARGPRRKKAAVPMA